MEKIKKSAEKVDTKQKPKLANIKLEKLHPFEEHPYKILDDESMEKLKNSIEEKGLLNHIIVRPLENTDEYEIISGHRRVHAVELLGIKEVPAIVYFIGRDEATVLMVDSNCQRESLSPMEKAKAYRMKLDAIKHQGTSSQIETKLRSDEQVAKDNGDSRATVQRLIRLTYLVPELQEYVDEGKMKVSPAVEISFLDEELQRDIVDRIDETEIFPSHAQARRMRQLAAECVVMGFDTELTFQKLDDVSYILCTKDVPYIATNPDYVCPTEYGSVPDCGSVCDMIYNATGKRPFVIGKPSPLMIQLAMEKAGVTPDETAVVGDRIYTDVKSGLNAGAVGVLVMSGETTEDILKTSPDKPDIVLTSAAEIIKYLKR